MDSNSKRLPINESFQRTEDFASVYANNIFMEASVWDLKLLFGELDQSVNPLIVQQHTGVTIPWAQAKLLVYFLAAQVAGHEIAHGKIDIPVAVRPPAIAPPTDSDIEREPHAPRVYEAIKKLHEEFMKNI